jgi:hypothetical protein
MGRAFLAELKNDFNTLVDDCRRDNYLSYGFGALNYFNQNKSGLQRTSKLIDKRRILES